jgi:hypothetical protein
VRITDEKQMDVVVLNWLKEAYDEALPVDQAYQLTKSR